MEGPFYKSGIQGGTLNRIEGKGGAFWQNNPFFSPSLPAEQGRRARAPAAAPAGGLDHGGGREEGERDREVRGSDPPSISGKGARKEGCHGGGR